jgi:hypothetical protein
VLYGGDVDAGRVVEIVEGGEGIEEAVNGLD